MYLPKGLILLVGSQVDIVVSKHAPRDEILVKLCARFVKLCARFDYAMNGCSSQRQKEARATQLQQKQADPRCLRARIIACSWLPGGTKVVRAWEVTAGRFLCSMAVVGFFAVAVPSVRDVSTSTKLSSN